MNVKTKVGIVSGIALIVVIVAVLSQVSNVERHEDRGVQMEFVSKNMLSCMKGALDKRNVRYRVYYVDGHEWLGLSDQKDDPLFYRVMDTDCGDVR